MHLSRVFVASDLQHSTQCTSFTCSVVVLSRGFAALVALHMWLLLIHLNHLLLVGGLLWVLVISDTYQPWKTNGDALHGICQTSCSLMHWADGQICSLYLPYTFGIKPHIWYKCLTIPMSHNQHLIHSTTLMTPCTSTHICCILGWMYGRATQGNSRGYLQ